jgi:hypothetical protein
MRILRGTRVSLKYMYVYIDILINVARSCYRRYDDWTQNDIDNAERVGEWCVAVAGFFSPTYAIGMSAVCAGVSVVFFQLFLSARLSSPSPSSGFPSRSRLKTAFKFCALQRECERASECVCVSVCWCVLACVCASFPKLLSQIFLARQRRRVGELLLFGCCCFSL